MTPDQVRVILDALEFQESKLQAQLDREPKTRSGKLNPLVRALQKELSDIGLVREAMRTSEASRRDKRRPEADCGTCQR